RADRLYDALEGLPPAARAQRQIDRLRDAVAAAARAPFMRERLRECGLRVEDVLGVESLSRLPVLRKDALPAVQAQAPPFGGLLGAPAALRAAGIIGTPSFVLTLRERAADLGLRAAVEVACVSGEYLTAAQRRRAREGFGVRVSQAYATADVGLVAYECPAVEGLHVA